jgi:hypothetical protein
MKEAATELLGDRRAAANGMLEVSKMLQLDPSPCSLHVKLSACWSYCMLY